MASVTLDVIMRFVDQVSGKLNQVNSALNATNQAGAKVNTTMQALSVGLTGLTAFGVYETLKRIATGLYDVAQAGAAFERVEDSFKVMTDLEGQNFVTMLGDMRAAARGTASDMQLMLSANKALSLGVATTSKEMAQLVEVSTALGRRTGLGQEQALERLLVGIGRLSPRILDDLGIAVSLTRLFREETGKLSVELDQETKIQVLLNKVLRDGNEIISKYPQGLDDAASGFERLSAAWQNFKVEIGESDPFQKTVDWFNDRTIEMTQNRVVSNAGSGVASVTEITTALKYYNAELEQAGNNPLFYDIEHVAEMRVNVELLTKALEAARYAEFEFNKNQQLMAQFNPESNYDWMHLVDVRGDAVLRTMEQLKQAQKDLAAVSIGSDQGQIDKYTAKVEFLKNILMSTGYQYNIIAEELESPLINLSMLGQGLLQMENLSEEFDVFSKAKERDTSVTKMSAEAQEEFNRKLKDAEHAYVALAAAKKGAFEGDVVDLLVSDSSSGAQQASRQASANLSGELQRIQSMVTAGMYSEQQAVIAITQAYESANGVLEDYVDTKDKQRIATQEGVLRSTSSDILSTVAELREAMIAFEQGTGSTATVEAAQRVSDLRGELVSLATVYNEIATTLGLELIDIEALKQGEIAVQDLTLGLTVFNQKQQEVPIYAALAGDALSREAAQADALKAAIGGFEAVLRGQIAGMADILDAQQMQQMYNDGLAEMDQRQKGIVESGGDVSDMLWDVIDAQEEYTSGLQDYASAARTADSDSKDLANTIQNKLKSAFDSLNSVVSGELRASLNELSNVGIGADDLEQFGGRQDVPAENARRLAALMKEGVKDQPWLEEFKAEAPGIWDEYINAADPAAAAARMLTEFNQGLRPELIDFGQLKQQIKDKIAADMQLEGMAEQLTAELIAEMGTGQSGAIQKFVGEALGMGVEESPFSSDASAKLLSQFQSVDFAEQMKTAGGVSAQNWALGFNNDVPEYMLPFIDILASYVLPIVQANIVATATATGAK